MFSETNKYKNNGHFFYQKGKSLMEVSKDVPDLPGVYYIVRLARGRVDLVYIGKSGTMMQDGTFKNQTLRKRINNKHGDMKRQDFFDLKIQQENIDALDIYWFVTFDNKHKDLPALVEGVLMQRYFDVHGTLPPWNKDF